MFKKSILILFFSFTLLSQSSVVFAESCADKICTKDSGEYISCLESKKQCLQEELEKTQDKKNTLENTISVISGSINIQEVSIRQTLGEIDKLENEIANLDNRIDGLSISLDRLSTLLIDRIRTQYKQSRTNNIASLFASKSLSKFISQYRYISLAGKQTADAMQRAESQREIYDEQKDIKEIKQEEIEQKQYQLQVQQNQLVSQRQEQQNILGVTKNDEARFQQLIEEAQKELIQIQNAANIVIREGNAISVKRGETIGTMGNSGYSTGAHLHFGIYRYSIAQFEESSDWGWYYSNYINPLSKLEATTVYWGTDCGNDPSGNVSSGTGNWQWPMSSARITQSYGGNTCYNYFYGGKDHPALDIVGMSNISVKAVNDGDAYFCRNCLGDGGNGVFVFHDDNYMSLYWHLK